MASEKRKFNNFGNFLNEKGSSTPFKLQSKNINDMKYNTFNQTKHHSAYNKGSFMDIGYIQPRR